MRRAKLASVNVGRDLVGRDVREVVVVRRVLTFVVAIVVTRRARTRETAGGYFLAGRNTGWFIVGASLFGTVQRYSPVLRSTAAI